MNIRLVGKVSDADAAALWGGIEHPMGTEFLDLEWRAKDLHFILDDDATAEPLSHVSLLKQDVDAAGRVIPVGGIGGVFTAPAARGCGLAARLIDHVLRYARDELGCRFAMLLCNDRLLPYYRRLGWQHIDDAVTMLHRGAPTPCPANVMIMPLTDEPWPAGPVDLRSRPW